MALNQYGGVGGGMTSERIGSGGGGLYNGPLAANNFLSGGGGGGGVGINIPSAAQANQANYIAANNAMMADPAYQAAKGFLNPNDPTAMWDVAMKGAEHAAGTGMGGSGIAGQYTGRLRQYDIERRAALGNQILSGAYGRQPAPVNPYAQAQLQLDVNKENNRMLSSIQSRYAPSGGFSQGGGGGGRSAPMVIGAGGTGGGGGGGYSPVRPYMPTGGGTPAGSNQVALGFGGPDWNAANQRSQFGPASEFAPGTMYAGSVAGAPKNTDSQLSDDEWLDLYAA